MTRIAILIAILCALAGAIYFSYDSFHKKELEVARLEASSGPRYLYAKRDLMVGSVIREGDVVANPLSPNIPKPLMAFTEKQKGYVIGQRTKYGFSAGQIILNHQLMP
jgi:SAF domain.